MSVARFQISVVEARDVQGDWLSPPKFYVRVKTQRTQAVTDVVVAKNPHFLSDLRLEIDPDDADDYLEVALLQSGEHGDLVIGAFELKPADVRLEESTPRWYQMKDPEGTVTGELRLVIRRLTPAGVGEPQGVPSAAVVEEETTRDAVEDAKKRPRRRHWIKLALSLTTFLVSVSGLVRRGPEIRTRIFDDPGDLLPTLAKWWELRCMIDS